MKKRESISPDVITMNTCFVVAETTECMGTVLKLLHNDISERLHAKLSFERVITNLHQLIKIYEKHLNLTLNGEEKKAYGRLKPIRQALVHASTDIEFIKKSTAIRGSYNIIGPNTPNGIRCDDIVLGNCLSDDYKVFYGSSYVLIIRDLLRLTCKTVEHYNQYAATFWQSGWAISPAIDWALTNDESDIVLIKV